MRLTILAELRQEHAEEGVGDKFGTGEQGVQVEPLVAQLPHRQPVFTEVTDVRLHQAEVEHISMFKHTLNILALFSFFFNSWGTAKTNKLKPQPCLRP